MWFNTESEYNQEMNDLLENLSPFGQEMRYYYHELMRQDFLTAFDSLFYVIKTRPFGHAFVSKDDDYLTYRVHGESDQDNKDFDYTVNKYGFRSEKLTPLNENNINILTAGCSVTFGMGLPNNFRWPIILKNKIENDLKRKIVLHDISVSGIDSIKEIHNIYAYIEKFGKPNYIFVNLPPIYRRSTLDKKSYRMTTTQGVDYLSTNEEVEGYLLDSHKEYGVSFFENIISIRQLEIFCNLLGIKLLWMTWCDGTNEYYDKFMFKNFIKRSREYKKFLNERNSDMAKKYWERARDNAHFGYMYQLSYADLFYNEWKKNEI